MSMLRMCLRWKVLGFIALVAGGVALVAPSQALALLPLVLLAACPLAMLPMAVGMGRMSPHGPEETDTEPRSASPRQAVDIDAQLAQLRLARAEADETIGRLERERLVAAGATPSTAHER